MQGFLFFSLTTITSSHLSMDVLKTPSPSRERNKWERTHGRQLTVTLGLSPCPFHFSGFHKPSSLFSLLLSPVPSSLAFLAWKPLASSPSFTERAASQSGGPGRGRICVLQIQPLLPGTLSKPPCTQEELSPKELSFTRARKAYWLHIIALFLYSLKREFLSIWYKCVCDLKLGENWMWGRSTIIVNQSTLLDHNRDIKIKLSILKSRVRQKS